MLDVHFDIGKVGFGGQVAWSGYPSLVWRWTGHIMVSEPFWAPFGMVLEQDEEWDMRRSQAGCVGIGLWGKRRLNFWVSRHSPLGRVLDLLPRQVVVMRKTR